MHPGPAGRRNREEGQPLRGGGWPKGCCSRDLCFGPQGPGTGSSSQPALCLLMPPPHPRGVPRGAEQLVLAPRKVRPSTLCSGGQRGRVLSSGQWTVCAHLLQGRVTWHVPAGDSQPPQWPGIAGTPGRVQPPHQGPFKRRRKAANPPIGRGPRRERWQEQRSEKLLRQEDKRRAARYTHSILNLAAPTILP